MNATFLDENGKSQPFIMGCYGIGVGRTMAAAIEQNHDENGIIWPLPIAPFQVEILTLNGKDGDVVMAGDNLYNEFQAEGIDVLYDDRTDRAGVKFADADLMGIPIQIVIGGRSLEKGEVEVKLRRDGGKESVSINQITAHIRSFIAL